MIDIIAAADFLALEYRETRDQIDAMERNSKFTAEEIQKRRGRLHLKAQAVHIVRVVANDAAISELVMQQLEAR